MERIEIRMEPLRRSGAIAFGGLGLIGAAMAAGDLADRASAAGLAAALAGALGGLWFVRLGMRRGHEIDVGPQGVRLASGVTSGLIPWDNLEKVGIVRIFGFAQLGFALRDRSRFQAAGSFDQQLSDLSFRAALAVPQPLMGPLARLAGWAPLPGGAGADLLAWQRASFGHEILLPLYGGAPDDIPARIERHRPPGMAPPSPAPTGPLATPAPASAPAPAAAPVAADGDLKTCPMCAEEVRRAARICRFCRHEFTDVATSAP